MQKAFKAVTLIGKYMDPLMREYVQSLAGFLNERGVSVTVETVTA